LLETIKVPKNLSKLNRILPKKKYDSLEEPDFVTAPTEEFKQEEQVKPKLPKMKLHKRANLPRAKPAEKPKGGAG